MVVLAVMVTMRAARASPVVLDGETAAPIAGATIVVGTRTVVTDAAGRFALEAEQPVEVIITAKGYDSVSESVGNESVVLLFRPGAIGEVVEMEERAPRQSATSSTLLSRDEIRSLPGGGEDALAAVRSMPGVGQGSPTAGGRMVIRGSAPEDTRLTVDGISVPFLYHAFDNATIVPVSQVASVEYTPGGFGVEEGRATGGLVALTTDDTQPARPTGEAAISLLEVSARAAAPLWRSRKVSIAGGLRRSTVDLLAPYAVPPDAEVGFTTAPRFYDGQLRLDWRASEHDKVAVLGIVSADALGVVNRDMESDLPSAFSTETQFGRLIASWKHRKGRVENRIAGALAHDKWSAHIGIDQNVDGEHTGAQLRDDLRVELGQHVQVRAGGAAELSNIDVHALAILPPSEGLPSGRIDELPIAMIDERYVTAYAGAYAATDVMPTKHTTITSGIRVERFAHLDALRVLPRAQLRHRAGPVTITAALGRYARDLDGAEGIPRDLRPELATQATLGVEVQVADGISASLAGFATERRDLVVEDASRLEAGELPYRSGGTGTSRGGEVLVRAKRGSFFGWIAYTLSKSERRDSPVEAARPFAYDQTHLLSAVASWENGPWRVGGRWSLASGLPYTEVIGATYVPEIAMYVPMFAAPFAARHDTSHQLDLRVERTFHRNGYTLAVFADLGNVYRRARVLRWQYSEDYSTKRPISDLMPLPSIGVRGEF